MLASCMVLSSVMMVKSQGTPEGEHGTRLALDDFTGSLSLAYRRSGSDENP
jgi:hypothetical protein